MFKKLLSLIGAKRHREEAPVAQKKRKRCKCPICTEIIVKCVITNCGHTFCEYCLEQSMMYSSSCPLCRKKISLSSYIPCKSIDNFIRSQLTEKQKESYFLRLDLTAKWNEDKKLKDSKVGMKIDALNTDGIWCPAVIQLKIDNGENNSLLYVHFENGECSYDEILSETSKKVAPAGFFTARNITKYRMGSIAGVGNTNY